MKKITMPPALKHSKHTFSGLIRCECVAFILLKHQNIKEIEFQVVKQEIIMMILHLIRFVKMEVVTLNF